MKACDDFDLGDYCRCYTIMIYKMDPNVISYYILFIIKTKIALSS